MMQFIREHSKSPWAKALFVGIGISLMGIGGAGIFGSSSSDAVASVGGQKIPLIEVDRLYQQLLTQQNGAELSDAEQAQLKLIARREVIQRAAIDEQIRNWGIRASDSDVAKEIAALPLFQVDGQFNPEEYKMRVAYLGFTTEGFEEQVRRDVGQFRLNQAVAASSIVTHKELASQAEFSNQQRNLEVAVYNYADNLKNIEVSDEEIAKEFAENGEKYQSEERVKLQYIELNDDAIALDENATAPSAEQIEAKMKELKLTGEKRVSEQITIEFNNDEEREQALSQLNDLYERISSGEISFDEAKGEAEHFENAFYAHNGNFGFGDTAIPEFDELLFSLTEENPLGKPYTTNGEAHLVHLLKINSEYESEERLRTAAIRDLQQAQKANKYLDKEMRLQELAEVYTDSLLEIAEELGLKVKETEWLSLESREGLLANETVWNAINGFDVKENGKNSLPFSLNEGKNEAYIVRIGEHEPRRALTLEEAKESITKEIAAAKVREEMLAKVDELKEDLTPEEFAEKVKTLGFDYYAFPKQNLLELGELSNLDQAVQFGVLMGFQGVGALEDEKPVYLSDDFAGNLVLVAVNEVKLGNLEALSESEVKELEAYLQNRATNDEYQALMLHLINNSNIKLYENSYFK